MSDLLKLQMVAMEATRNLGFEQGVQAERARLQPLIDAAKDVRDSLLEYDQDENASGEIFYCEIMSESVDLLSYAVDEYEKEQGDE